MQLITLEILSLNKMFHVEHLSSQNHFQKNVPRGTFLTEH